MQIAVLGTGMVGQALAGRLADLGHDVTVGTRDVAATLAKTDPDQMGNPSFASWAHDHPTVKVAAFAEVGAGADVFVNATSGNVSIATLQAVGADALAGKILIDVANPLDFSAGFPPTLFVKDDDSLGERIQATFPDLLVVKALNTMTAALMVDPGSLAEGAHSVFVSGNDAGAKATVVALLQSFGHTDVVDLGDITTARGTEMVLPLWLRLMNALGTPLFGLKVVR